MYSAVLPPSLNVFLWAEITFLHLTHILFRQDDPHLIGYPALRILIVSSIPEYRSWRQLNSLVNIWAPRSALIGAAFGIGNGCSRAFYSGQLEFHRVSEDSLWKPTKGFLNSLGLTHLMKKGLHSPSVFISRSVDFLNCDDRVTWKRWNTCYETLSLKIGRDSFPST